MLHKYTLYIYNYIHICVYVYIYIIIIFVIIVIIAITTIIIIIIIIITLVSVEFVGLHYIYPAISRFPTPVYIMGCVHSIHSNRFYIRPNFRIDDLYK